MFQPKEKIPAFLYAYKNPKEKPFFLIGGILFILISIVLLVGTHIKTTHLFKINSLSKIRQEMTSAHLQIEDNLGKAYYVDKGKNAFSESKKVFKILLKSKDLGDYIIPLYSEQQHQEIKHIQSKLLEFESLTQKEANGLNTLQHDVVFNEIISRIDKLQTQLRFSLNGQLNFLFKLQILLFVIFSLFLAFSIDDTAKYRKRRKIFLQGQEALLKQLSQSNYFLEASQNISKLGYYTYDFKTKTWEASKIILEILNFKGGTSQLQMWIDIAHPDDLYILKNQLKKRQEDITSGFDIIYRVIRPLDKQILWVHHVAAPLQTNKEGNLLPVLGIIQDITKQKQTELDLQKSHEIAQLGTFELDLISKYFTRSEIFDKIVGFEIGSQKSLDDWCSITHPDDLIANRELLQWCIKNQSTYKRDCRIYTQDTHQLKWLQARGEIIYKDNVPSRFVGTFIDITKQKLAEQATLKSEAMLNAAQGIAKIGSFDFDIEKGSGFVSNEYCKITGLTNKQEINYDDWRNLVHPDDIEANVKMLKKCLKKGFTFDREYRIYPKGSKKYKWIHGKGKVFCKNNKIIKFIGTIQDITQRKRTELELSKNKNLLQLAHNINSIGVMTFDFSTGYFESTEMFDKIAGIPKNYTKDFEGWIHLVHPKDLKILQNIASDTSVSNTNPIEFRIIRPLDKKIIWVVGNGKKEFDHNNKFVKFTGTIQDITQRKKSEKRLKQSDVILSKLSTILLVVDKRGDITYASPSIKQALGYNPKDMLGQGWWENTYKDQKLAAKSKTTVLNHFFTEKSLSLDISERSILTKQGDTKWFEWRVSKGVGDTYISIGVDITEKRKLEHDFIQAFIDAQEQEKQSFGEELHDGLSQILSAENMYIELLLRTAKNKNDDTFKYLSTIKKLNVSAMDEARDIAHGLMSKQLKEHGLLVALTHICEDYNHSKNTEFEFDLQSITENEIANIIKINIFRLTQEITTNIIRHSGAKKAAISVSKTTDNFLKLVIVDNGIGMDLKKMKQERRGAGLKNIERRVKLLKGTLDLESELNKGTIYTIAVPL
ncbi:MAG: PAS domain-containing protein [Flavobacteriaceae bacterium]|nr:PAS domain-containing protein [Flavobacteriaceae bacterium]